VSKSGKKRVRAAFRDAVFSRDHYCCKVCGEKGSDETLDAHHITNRDLMPNGGYCAENGITLCKKLGGCHEKAEAFNWTTNIVPGFEPNTLYNHIGSTYERALEASKQLKEE